MPIQSAHAVNNSAGMSTRSKSPAYGIPSLLIFAARLSASFIVCVTSYMPCLTLALAHVIVSTVRVSNTPRAPDFIALSQRDRSFGGCASSYAPSFSVHGCLAERWMQWFWHFYQTPSMPLKFLPRWRCRFHIKRSTYEAIHWVASRQDEKEPGTGDTETKNPMGGARSSRPS